MLAGWNMSTDIHQIRAAISQMRATKPKPDPATLPYIEQDIEIPVRDGSRIAARVYKPRDSEPPESSGRPGFIVFHGGGFAVGDFEFEAWLCALFTRLGGIAVNVDYRLAPEYVFPTAINDAYDATKWVRLTRQWTIEDVQ